MGRREALAVERRAIRWDRCLKMRLQKAEIDGEAIRTVVRHRSWGLKMGVVGVLVVVVVVKNRDRRMLAFRWLWWYLASF
jgi:hypothetical protein